MKRLILCWLFFSALMFAQGGSQQNFPGAPVQFAGVPSGSCNVTQIAINAATGDLYTCPNTGNVWVKTSNSGTAGSNLVITANGTYTTLCAGLSAIATSAITGISDVWDYTPERGASAWTKDPFNDSTCGNNSALLGGTRIWFGRGTWMTQYPIQQPSSVEVVFNGRASENQVNPANAVGGTLLIACNTASPWTTTFLMSCPSSTNFPGGIISVIARAGSTVTVTTSSPHNFTAAMASAAVPVYITIANVTGATTPFNGNFVLASVPSATQLTYTQSGTTESGTVSSSSAVASPVWTVGNNGLGNNDFAAVLRGGTISSAGIPGSITLANHTDQERGIIDQVTLTGWQTYCIDISAAQAQNFDFTHLECISGAKTGATIGTPASAICINWEINGPSRGFNSLTCNPRGNATVAPILADVRVSGTQGGSFINEHMENAQYQYLVTASEAGVASRDIILINGNTGSTLQGQNISTIARAGITVTVTTANPTGAITGEKVIIASAAGGLSLALTSVDGAGVYQGTITGGAANAMVGQKFNITGFVNGANNLTGATVTASTATALTFTAVTVIETHAGTAASTFSGTYSSLTVISGTSFSYTDTSSVTDSGTSGTETMGGMATFKMCGTGSTVSACRTGANVLRTIAMGSVRISPSIVLDAVEDDPNSKTITSGAWNGSYFESAPDTGTALAQANGGTGASALVGTDTGTSTAYVVAGTAIVTLTSGLSGCFMPANANSGATPTVAFNGLTAKTIVKYNGQSLAANVDMLTTQPACVTYNGTNMLLMNPQGVTGSGKVMLQASPSVTGVLTAPSVTTTNVLLTSAAPTVSSGFGTSPSIVGNNGTATFTVNVGTGGVATSGVIGLPAATNGWVVHCDDLTTSSSTVFITKQTASSTTTATIGNFNTAAAAAAWVASDILHCTAFAR